METDKRAIDALRAGEKRFVAWDEELPGFGVRINSGGDRVYVLKYRQDGEQRWYTIGRHGAPWARAQARKQALKLLGKIALGGDPARKRREDRAAITVAELCRDHLERAWHIRSRSR